MNHLSRRGFLGGLGALAAGIAWPARAQAESARVASVTDGRVWVGDGWADADLDRPGTRAMIERALVELTGELTAGAALAALIPALEDPAQRYGIKINCVNARLPTHPVVVTALTELLIDAGARADHIVVFDRTDHELAECGFPIHRGAHVQVYGNSHDDVGYMDAAVTLTHGSVRLCRIIDEVDHLINMPVLKNHEMAGVTLALKNHFGSIDRPEQLHAPDRSCCPGVAELNNLPAIADKTRLVLIDGLFATFESGLAALPDFAPMTVIAATDPVAADTAGRDLIDTRRHEARLPPVEARHIDEAARAGVGTTNVDAVHVELSPALEKPRPWLTEEGCQCASAPTVLTTAAAALVGKMMSPPRRGTLTSKALAPPRNACAPPSSPDA